MKDILEVSEIPEANELQCCTYKMHSLQAAKEIAQDTLNKGIGIMDNEALKLDL